MPEAALSINKLARLHYKQLFQVKMQRSSLLDACASHCIVTHQVLISTMDQCYQTLYVRNLRIFVISQSVCPCQPFHSWVGSRPYSKTLDQAVQCLQVRPEAYPRVEHTKVASLGLAPALLANITLGWKDLHSRQSHKIGPRVHIHNTSFLRNLQMDWIRQSDCHQQVFPALCNVTLQLIGLNLKIRGK